MSGERSARINRANGNPLGASLFLSDDELRELGIDPDGAQQVRYQVEDGELVLNGGGT